MATREKSKRQQTFETERADYTEQEIQMENLYCNWLTSVRVEKTRANTSTIVWIMAIGIILSIIAFVSTLNL